jgi:hypothetical protein
VQTKAMKSLFMKEETERVSTARRGFS